MDKRPDPDEILKHVEVEESTRGKLKIFLGYAAGVGKTYAMLEAAHQRKEQGVDVVVGIIETHGRAETEAMLEGLEVVPRRVSEYQTVRLTEMDADAILKRRPGLVLVDELAHTNAPGSRHMKRYLDVEELLNQGIDVYTTLNIQHLESLNDVVAQVTGVVVRETVPDRIIDEATEIEVIDLPPDELLVRLKEGKVYVSEQAAHAIEKFFRKGNLTALREMSLRRAAERVDDQMRAYMQTRAIAGPWAASERLLVCVSPSPLAEKLVRTTRRLADELNAEWFAVYVNLASRPELNPANRERIGRTMQLAEELGGKALTLAGNKFPEAVLSYAHKHNITKIVIGKPLRPRWQELLNGSVVDQLIRASGDIDIYVISARSNLSMPAIPKEWQPHHPLGRYLISLGLIGIATLLGVLVRNSLEPANLVMLYLAVVVIAAIYLGRGPSLLAAVCGVLSFDFFLIPPYLTFAVSDTQYFLTFVGLFVVSLVVSTLTVRVREQATAAIQREAQTSALFSLGRELTSAADLAQIAAAMINHIGEALDCQIVVYLPEGDRLYALANSPGMELNANEQAVASWVFEHDETAGLGTNTLPAARLRCIPLKTARGLVGVLGVRPNKAGGLLHADQRQALNGFANQSALAIERAALVEQARQNALLQATEKLQTALLNSISHDLRTPLVAITGALSALDEDHGELDATTRKMLVENARAEADRLNRLVGNLLNMTRIEAGVLRLVKEPCDVADVINSALMAAETRLNNHPVHVSMQDNLPMIPMDFVLMVQVLVNILDNAAKYSPAPQPIVLQVNLANQELVIRVCDAGPGIPQADAERIFDKFYRVHQPGSVSGTGLGLSICKGIIEAHNGSIRAENRLEGGLQLIIHLPIE